MHITITNLIKSALSDGGATVYLNNTRARFIVGGMRSHWVPAEFSLASASIANAVRQLNGATGDTLGSWYDGDTGMIHLDYGTVHRELGAALAVAAERGELAIWDTELNREIRVAP